MVVVPGPVEFQMGSPETEAGRQDNEGRHRRRIGRTFAMAAKPVTLEQYRRFVANHAVSGDQFRSGDLPAASINWYMAAYCNWLSKAEGIPEDRWCYDIVAVRETMFAPTVRVQAETKAHVRPVVFSDD